jgi:16S rRNA processing protein RimM
MTDEQHRDSTPDETPDRLTIGRIVSPHGVRGEFRMYIYTHFPERIPELPGVYLGDEDRLRKIRRVRLQGNLAIMRLEGINSREEVDELRQTPVQIDIEDAAPLEEGEHYHYQILGLKAYDESGTELGTVVDIIETGANDVYVIRNDEGKDLLVPALHDVVPEIDVEAGRMVVRPLTYYDES